MKYIKYNSIALFMLLAFITACSDDFLDLKPIAKPTTETYYSSFNALEATVTAAYGELCAREVFDKDYYLTVGSIPSDDVECGGSSITDYPNAQHYDQFSHDLSDAAPIEEIWRYCYKGLRFVNTSLVNLPIIKEVDSTASDVLIAQRTGEMKFIRALYHFMLVQVFGGVPIADHEIVPGDFSNPRNSISEVLHFIEQDLKDAIPALPTKDQLVPFYGRASKGAAQALLAKALIYESSYAKNYPDDVRFQGCEQKWLEALNYAKDVINSGTYSLVAQNGGTFTSSWRTDMKSYDGYRWMFTVEGDNCSESIFEIQNANDGLGYGVTRGNVMTVYQTVRNYTTATGGVGTHSGWSFNLPTQYLLDAFRNADARETGLNSAPLPLGDEDLDPRFATTVGREGDSILLADATQTYVPMNFSNLPTGTIGRKFECGFDEYWAANTFTQGPYNVRLIRYADLLLLAAEAALEVGGAEQANALDYVNRVRTRARNCGITGYPLDLTAVNMNDVIHERRLELTCEPHRFFDLVRWGLTDEYINGIEIVALPGYTVTFVKGKHEFWPIPQSEVDYSKGGLVNYPGWQ